MPTPTTSAPHDQRFRRDLGDGLRLRWSTPDDTERLIALYRFVFRDSPDQPLNDTLPVWIEDMMSGRHPLITPHDFALVENTRSGAVVAATCLLRATWEYEGIALPAGRPEVVATDPEYRHRGLVRAIFELIHARSQARGDLAQGITGIAYFYRQFGYEYAMDLDAWRTTHFSAIPALKPDATEPYTLRQATADDIPLLRAIYDHERADALVSSQIDEAYWRWVLGGMHPQSGECWKTYLIAASDGRGVGYVWVGPLRRTVRVVIWGLATLPEVSLLAVMPSVLRGIQALAPGIRLRQPDLPPADQIRWYLGVEHAAYTALNDLVETSIVPPYAWYVRVPDVPALLLRIAPVLARRLAASPLAAGYSGELTLDFHRGGLRLVFAEGRLTAAEDWHLPVWGTAGAGFPPLVFLQLLFGHRSLDELRAIYPDVEAEYEAGVVLRALFPKRRSLLRPLD
jgi:hypothetical protein